MSENAWILTVAVSVVAMFWGGAKYGEGTDRPVWLAGVIALLISSAAALVFFFWMTRGSNWRDGFMIVGGYLIMLPVGLAVGVYCAAREGRKTRRARVIRIIE